MKLVDEVVKKSRNLIKNCSVVWDGEEFNTRVRILKIKIETDYTTKKTTLYYFPDSKPLEFLIEFTKNKKDYTKFSTIHVHFINNKTVKITKDSTYITDNNTIHYHKEWIIKTGSIDFTKQINLLKELAESNIADCKQALYVITNFNNFQNTILDVANKSGLVKKYVKRVYADDKNMLNYYDDDYTDS